jgi:pimeloyl-ACP methyl ester carboxylesterase
MGLSPGGDSGPHFVWQGDADSSIPFRWGEWWEGAVPGARLIRGPGEGHLLVEERMEEVLGTLTSEEEMTR